MTSDLSHMADLLEMRAPTQRVVLRSLLRGHQTCQDIASDIPGLSENAVNIALHQLAKKGIIQRIRRGVYEPNVEVICLALMDRIDNLEKKRRRRR